MKHHNTLNIRELLLLNGDENLNEIHDMVRRIVPATEVRFTNGAMGLSLEGVATLAQAVIDRRIGGSHTKARELLEEVTPLLPDYLLTIAAARKICMDIIEGRSEGNVERARQLVKQFDQIEPGGQ